MELSCGLLQSYKCCSLCSSPLQSGAATVTNQVLRHGINAALEEGFVALWMENKIITALSRSALYFLYSWEEWFLRSSWKAVSSLTDIFITVGSPIPHESVRKGTKINQKQRLQLQAIVTSSKPLWLCLRLQRQQVELHPTTASLNVQSTARLLKSREHLILRATERKLTKDMCWVFFHLFYSFSPLEYFDTIWSHLLVLLMKIWGEETVFA